MSLQTFFEAWILATYVNATPEKRRQMLEVARSDSDTTMYKAFMATGLNIQSQAPPQERTNNDD